MTRESQNRDLEALARMYGVQPSYRANDGATQAASPDALLAVLRALGAPIETLRDVPDAIRSRRLDRWRLVMEPVVVSWPGSTVAPPGPGVSALHLPWGSRLYEEGVDAPGAMDTRWLDPHQGGLPGVVVRLPRTETGGALRIVLRQESGEVRTWDGRLSDLAGRSDHDVEGLAMVAAWLPLPRNLPHGYHTLRLELAGEFHEALVIDAPARAYDPFAPVAPDVGAGSARGWGVFAPLYGLHGRKPGSGADAEATWYWRHGDLGHLGALAEWVGGLGGDIVGTLPLLAAFLDEPFDPSPYAPVSRLFWNELYIDLERVPGLEHCPAARSALASEEVRIALLAGAGSDQRHVDYRAAAMARRRVLEPLARDFFRNGGDGDDDFSAFVGERAHLDEYARFRALTEWHGGGWLDWPEPRPSWQPDGEAVRYHRYVQWLADRQLAVAAERADEAGAGYYMDLPLGVSPGGFDTWRWPELFAEGASGGAPPDAFFSRGQDWGFPPMHPARIREDRHTYTIDCYRHQMRHARALRIDHVMGLHRLYWVPHGGDARHGVYVRYPANELYAILCIESHRNRALIVGEDLGTVPDEVREAMGHHDIRRMYVAQFALTDDPEDPLGRPPPGSLAAVNTHDMPSFASFWTGGDVADRVDLGLLDHDQAASEREHRARLRRALVRTLELAGDDPDAGDPAPDLVLSALLERLAASGAGLVLATLEDLWLEPEPQNTPGTAHERPNWRRGLRYGLDEIIGNDAVERVLSRVDQARRGES